MSPTPKTIRLCLHGGSWSLAAATAMVGAWGVWPVGQPVNETSIRRPVKVTQNVDRSSDLIPSELLQRPLQGKKVTAEPVAKKAVAEKTQAPPKRVATTATRSMGLRLVGTVIEDGQGIAITSDRNGDIAFSKVGQSVSASEGSAVVEKITKSVVLIRYQGKRTRMQVGQELTAVGSGTSAATQKPAAEQSRRRSANRSTDESSTPESLDISDDFDIYDDSDIPNDRTPISPDEFPKMSLEEELEFLNGF